jgi:hypothetical protein
MARQRAVVAVDVSPEAIFAVLERDRTRFRTDDLVRWEPVGALPFGPGYRFRSSWTHADKPCEITYRVTSFDRPRVLEEEWHHHCHAAGRTHQGRDRWELQADGDGTIMIGTFERRMSFLDSVVASLKVAVCNPHRTRLLRLALRAEAVEQAPVASTV